MNDTKANEITRGTVIPRQESPMKVHATTLIDGNRCRSVRTPDGEFMISDSDNPTMRAGDSVTVSYDPADQFAKIVVTYASRMQGICCEENHKAFATEFKDITLGEIKMYHGLPGFVVVLPDGTANLRTFGPAGELTVTKVIVNKVETPEKPCRDPGEQFNIDQLVLAGIKKAGIKASYEYPGFICIPMGELCWNIGTINPTWTADLTTQDGECLMSRELTAECDGLRLALASSLENPELVVAAITALYEETRVIPPAYVRAMALASDIAQSTKDTIWQPDWHSLRARALTIVGGGK